MKLEEVSYCFWPIGSLKQVISFSGNCMAYINCHFLRINFKSKGLNYCYKPSMLNIWLQRSYWGIQAHFFIYYVILHIFTYNLFDQKFALIWRIASQTIGRYSADLYKHLSAFCTNHLCLWCYLWVVFPNWKQEWLLNFVSDLGYLRLKRDSYLALPEITPVH